MPPVGCVVITVALFTVPVSTVFRTYNVRFLKRRTKSERTNNVYETAADDNTRHLCLNCHFVRSESSFCCVQWRSVWELKGQFSKAVVDVYSPVNTTGSVNQVAEFCSLMLRLRKQHTHTQTHTHKKTVWDALVANKHRGPTLIPSNNNNNSY